MAGASLLTLLDDIAAVLDDVALMTKVAAKKSAAIADDVTTMTKVATQKTAGVLGDDLALNAQQVAGVRADRELPVVWAVAKGSLVNKAILVPAALLISAFLPSLIVPLLMLGGAFLCFEGAEKIVHKLHHAKGDDSAKADITEQYADLAAMEKDKIKGAVRTDFILSAEIIVIALGTIAAAPFVQQVSVLIAIALVMTAGVYGLVAGIVKIDDAGLWLGRRESSVSQAFGRFLLNLAPWLMKFLAFAGTLAMFLVGGGILVHGIAPLHHVVEGLAQSSGVAWLVSNSLNALAGLVAGLLILAVLKAKQRLQKKS
ncbi:conserved hypothetical protein [gamma proteobacterium HdN1]|nr:conserved hypothetical protein [gamma proteobacterium HdN1]